MNLVEFIFQFAETKFSAKTFSFDLINERFRAMILVIFQNESKYSKIFSVFSCKRKSKLLDFISELSKVGISVPHFIDFGLTKIGHSS